MEKPAFRELFPTHRCVVPCDGFYEWKQQGRERTPFFVHEAKGQLLLMAGLWNQWHSPEGLTVTTFAIVTTPASATVQPVHSRMPAFLDQEGCRRWLSGPTQDLSGLQELLRPWHGSVLELSSVSTRVNSVANDDERCLEAPTTEQLTLL